LMIAGYYHCRSAMSPSRINVPHTFVAVVNLANKHLITYIPIMLACR
jgi:hypothetical protein